MKLKVDYPVKAVCKALAFSTSSYYYKAKEPDTALKTAIEKLAEQWPTYGYRRITAMLHRQGLKVNRKRTLRLMREIGLLQKPKRSKKRTTNSKHRYKRYQNLVKDLKIKQPDQVWVADITYIHLQKEFIYLAVIMDVFTRDIRGWELSHSIDHSLTVSALKKALKKYKPEIHHSDQGVQYASSDYIRLLKDAGTEVSMAEVGEPTQNGYAERLIRTIKEEEVQLSEYENFEDARKQIAQFLDDVYKNKRIHSSLGYLTPAEFEEKFNNTP